MRKVFKIEVDCAVCAQKCEDAIKKVNGVLECQINFITQKMTIDIDGDLDKVMKEVEKVAKRIEPDFEIER